MILILDWVQVSAEPKPIPLTFTIYGIWARADCISTLHTQNKHSNNRPNFYSNFWCVR